MSAFEKIEAQQNGLENTDTWILGEQLKDILRREPWNEELLAQDLDVKEMSLKKAAAKIKDWADQQPRKGNCVCVPPNVAEKIIREFYGLPETGATAETPKPAVGSGSKILDLSSFL